MMVSLVIFLLYPPGPPANYTGEGLYKHILDLDETQLTLFLLSYPFVFVLFAVYETNERWTTSVTKFPVNTSTVYSCSPLN